MFSDWAAHEDPRTAATVYGFVERMQGCRIAPARKDVVAQAGEPVLGQADFAGQIEYLIETASRLASGHRGAKQRRKQTALLAQSGGQRTALHHPRAQRQDHALGAAFAGVGQGGKRLINRQSAANQDRQLPCEGRQLARRHASTPGQLALAAVGHRHHFQGIEPALTQRTAGRPRGVGLQHAALIATLGVESEIGESRHGAQV